MMNEYTTADKAALLIQNRISTYPLRGARRVALWVRFFSAFAIVYVLLLAFTSDSIAAALNPTRGTLGLGLLAAGLVAVVAVLETDLSIRLMKRDPYAAAKRLAARFRALTDPGWALRTTAMGVLLGLSVGIGVSLLSAPEALSKTEFRTAHFVRIMAMATVWSIPVAFVTRYVYLRKWFSYAPSR